MDWETLRVQSLENPRKNQMTLGLRGVTELGSYPPGSYRIRRTPRDMVRDAQVLDHHREANATLPDIDAQVASQQLEGFASDPDLMNNRSNGTLPGTPSRPLVKRGPVVWALPSAGTGTP